MKKNLISKETKKKLSEARKRYLQRADAEVLNRVYRKIAETKKRRYQEGLITPWNKGKRLPPLSIEQKLKISNSLKGRKVPSEKLRKSTILRNKTNNPMWNPEIVEKAVKNRNYEEIARKTTLTKRKNGTFLKYSERMKKNNPMKDPIINAKVNKNPEYMRRRIQSLIKKPNNKEKLLLEIINKNNLPYEYVGDGKIIIGSKNPDFIHKTKNKIIEIFGTYWHSNKKVRCYEETEEGRIEFFKQYGFETLVIWEDELKNQDLVLKKIKLLGHQ